MSVQEDTTVHEKPKLPKLPYIQRTLEYIQWVCRRISVKMVLRSSGTLRGSLMKVKNPRPPSLTKGVVYKVPCRDWNRSYVSETWRNLKKRLVEHRAAAKRGDTKNGITVHAWEHQHRVDLDEASVLAEEPRYWILEAMEIQKHAENTNLDCGLAFSPIWALYLSLWLVSPHIYHVRVLIFIITSFPAYPFIRIVITCIFPCTCAIRHCSWLRSTDRIHYTVYCATRS